MKSGVRIAACLAILLAVALVATGCGGGKKTPKVTPGTQSLGLPPLPIDLAVDVYKVDALYSKRCADVPSGMNNCLDLLRREAFRELTGVIEQQITGQQQDSGTQASRGDSAAGELSEDLLYARDFVRNWEAPVSLRKLESPVFALADGQTYALRVITLRSETDYLLLKEMAEKAKREDRDEIAKSFEARLKERYNGKPPDSAKVKNVERLVSEHYQYLWDTTQQSR